MTTALDPETRKAREVARRRTRLTTALGLVENELTWMRAHPHPSPGRQAQRLRTLRYRRDRLRAALKEVPA